MKAKRRVSAPRSRQAIAPIAHGTRQRRLLRQPHKRETIAIADPRNPGISVKFVERLAGSREN
jgi:hypothetical protein